MSTTPRPSSAASGKIARSASRWAGLQGTSTVSMRPLAMSSAGPLKAAAQ